MKMMINFELPLEPFNTLVRNGTAGATIEAVLEAIKPETVYFYAPNGCRGGAMVVEMQDASHLPSIAEPLFLKFNARLECHPVMTPSDLAKAGLDKLGKQWG